MMGAFRFAGARDEAGQPERARVTDPARRNRILTYLRDGAPVGSGHRTDGRWIWPESVLDDLAERQLAPEPELYERIAAHGYYCPPVTQAMVDAAEAALRERTTG
jgi:hypothetical protein